jgi:hypothetical protein
MLTYQNELVDQTLTAMLWSRRAADITRATLRISAFTSRAALAALIADHDQDQDQATRTLEDMDRVQSIVRSIINRAHDVQRARAEHNAWIFSRRNGPEPISAYCAAASMYAYHAGMPDPLLLARARHVLTYLPELVAPAGGQTSHGTITRLVHQLARLTGNDQSHPGGPITRRVQVDQQSGSLGPAACRSNPRTRTHQRLHDDAVVPL